MSDAVTLSPEQWMTHLFSAKAAREGGVVRRKIRDVERYVGMANFVDELDRRGYQAVENAGQIVIFCNRDPVHLVRRPIFAQKSVRSL